MKKEYVPTKTIEIRVQESDDAGFLYGIYEDGNELCVNEARTQKSGMERGIRKLNELFSVQNATVKRLKKQIRVLEAEKLRDSILNKSTP